MAGPSDVFGGPLLPDPQIALPLAPRSPQKAGPLHKVQLVIELVGQRTVPAGSITPLQSPEWRAALGEPAIFVMAPSDETWRALSAGAGGSYDSVALAWDLATPRGTLDASSAAHLLSISERFAQGIQRHAVPLPHPNDVDAAVARLLELREALDVGVSLSVLPRSGRVEEKTLWKLCAALGLTLSSDGSFQWRAGEEDEPAFSVTPLGGDETFSLGAASRGQVHPGVTIGFSVPRCPAPTEALDAAFRAADFLAQELDAVVLEEDGDLCTQAARERLKGNLAQALSALQEVGLPAGSPEALRVF
jgi:hypothetical protein